MKTVISTWTPEQWTAILTGVIAALGSCIATIVHAFASAKGRQENRAQNASIENKVSNIEGKLEGAPGAGEDSKP